MFDDITDKEDEEWEDWFDAGYHDRLARIILIVISFFVMFLILGSVRPDPMAISPAFQKSGAVSYTQQGESPDEGSDR